ncbi:hypothetical protein [Salinivibrio sp. PR6]|uniref:hypothetical protein n=1 Tax=Salinivibrio sp. PR6 TaxID=1909485 RepID=UPI0009893882|nr:hypothetical protein [Salinivibrio sp. PR6]
MTTHLIAVLTAFSAFTMPIALEVLNRVKNRYGSAHYMDSIEQIMGFEIQSLFRELIVTLIALISFALFVCSVDKAIFKDGYVLSMEFLFSLVTSILLVKEFKFIKTVFLATRSDNLVTEHLISKLRTKNKTNHSEEVELLVQIACYNIEHTAIISDKSTENRLFELIEKTCENQDWSIDTAAIKRLVDGLAATLTSARNTNSRDKYVSLQRNYGRLLVLFFDRKMKDYKIFDRFSQRFYEESIKELNTGQYWLLRADFLNRMQAWDIQNPQTIKFIDSHVRGLISFLVDKKPELLPDLIDNYRNFISFESHFDDDIYRLSQLFGSYNYSHFDEMNSFTEAHKELLTTNPQDYINHFILLLDKYVQDALTSSVSEQEREKIKLTTVDYEQQMVSEIIKKVGENAAKRTAQYTLRALANKSQWSCILDCHESFSPAHSRVSRLGVNLLPASLNSMIQQLGKSHGYSSLQSEELSHAYVRAVPILVMYAVYSWRLQNLDKNLHACISAITSSLSMGERSIQIANRMRNEIKLATYYAKSPVYAKAFCNHFDIKHEEAGFNSVVIPILREIQKYLNNQLIEIRKSQPLSEAIKQSYIDGVLMNGQDLANKFPLFSFVSLSKDKKVPCKLPSCSYERERFLDNTGVGYSSGSCNVIKRIHNIVALKIITQKGLPLSELEFEALENHHLLVMTSEDWKNFTSSKDRSDYRDVKRYLVFSGDPLDAYYVYDTKESPALVTLYNPEIDQESTPLNKNMSNALEFEFIDKEGEVTVEIDAHIYF